MKIELKRIHYYARQSEETNAFNADLYIDGKKVGETSNRGHGDPISYGSYTEEGKKAIQEAEEYCKTLPSEKFTSGGESYTYQMSLESFIGRIVDEFVNQKELQKFRNLVDRKCQDSLVVGKPDLQITVAYKYKITILQILCKPKGDEHIAEALRKDIIPLLKDGNILLNTNIPQYILELGGLKKGQYIDPKEAKIAAQNKQNRKPGKSL